VEHRRLNHAPALRRLGPNLATQAWTSGRQSLCQLGTAHRLVRAIRRERPNARQAPSMPAPAGPEQGPWRRAPEVETTHSRSASSRGLKPRVGAPARLRVRSNHLRSRLLLPRALLTACGQSLTEWCRRYLFRRWPCFLPATRSSPRWTTTQVRLRPKGHGRGGQALVGAGRTLHSTPKPPTLLHH